MSTRAEPEVPGWRSRDILRAAAIVAGVYVALKLLWVGRSVFLIGFFGVLLGAVGVEHGDGLLARKGHVDLRAPELRIGLDIVKDEAQQRLALTDRVWVPPMEYESVAPWMQLTWDIGPVTLSGGFRRQDDELHVDSYTTSAFRNSVFVEGGGVEYKEDLVNYGAVWRFAEGWSAATHEIIWRPRTTSAVRPARLAATPAARRSPRSRRR